MEFVYAWLDTTELVDLPLHVPLATISILTVLHVQVYPLVQAALQVIMFQDLLHVQLVAHQ